MTTPERPTIIMSEAFGQALVDAGIITDDISTIRRVVIDAQGGEILMMYIERFGDERLLSVATTLKGIEVHTGQPARSGVRYWVLINDQLWDDEPQWPAGFRPVRAGGRDSAHAVWWLFEDEGAPAELEGKSVEVTFTSEQDEHGNSKAVISERQIRS